MEDYDTDEAVPFIPGDALLEQALLNIVPVFADTYYGKQYVYEQCSKANQLFHQSEYAIAIDHYKAALERHNVPEVWLYLAIAYYFVAEYSNAVMTLNNYDGETYYDLKEDEYIHHTEPLVDPFYQLLQRKLSPEI